MIVGLVTVEVSMTAFQRMKKFRPSTLLGRRHVSLQSVDGESFHTGIILVLTLSWHDDLGEHVLWTCHGESYEDATEKINFKSDWWSGRWACTGACPETNCAWWLSTWRFPTSGCGARCCSATQEQGHSFFFFFFFRGGFVETLKENAVACTSNKLHEMFVEVLTKKSWQKTLRGRLRNLVGTSQPRSLRLWPSFLLGYWWY